VRRLISDRFILTVAADHPAFEGHFPGHPILPGVVLLAEVLSGAERCLGLPMDRVLVKVAKFHAAVGPGSTLTVELVQDNGAISFAVSSQGTRVASGTISVGADAGPGAAASGAIGDVPAAIGDAQ